MSDIFGHSCGLNIHPLENRPRLHNPVGLSWGLKSSSTGPQLGAKAPETAMPKLTQRVQSPPRTFWYVFYVSDIGNVENCWTTRYDANWSCTLARYLCFKSYEITTDRLSDTSRPRIFCLNVYDCKKELYVMLFMVRSPPDSSKWIHTRTDKGLNSPDACTGMFYCPSIGRAGATTGANIIFFL